MRRTACMGWQSMCKFMAPDLHGSTRIIRNLQDLKSGSAFVM